MNPPDESKIAFIPKDANFYYKVMFFGLKNTGATYQKLMDKVFKDLLGKNTEVYVDDMLAKSSNLEDHPNILVEIFAELRKHNIWLNLEKCVFGIGEGKFLGFMITYRGIEANLDKCEVVIALWSPQNLIGRLTFLSHFLPKLAKKAKHFFKSLKQPIDF